VFFFFNKAENSIRAIATVSFFNVGKEKKNESKNRKAIWFWYISTENVLIYVRTFFFAVKTQLLISLFLVLSQLVGAQDSRKVKFMAKLETRNSFVQTRHVTFMAVRLGVELKVPLKMGVGYNWILSRFNSQLYNPAEYPQGGGTAQLRMRYVFVYSDYSFYKEDNWELSVPLQLGIGETYYRSPKVGQFASGVVVPLEAGVAVSYLFTPWVGFGVGLGYRVMLKGNKRVKERFNSPYYELKLNILFTEILRGLKKGKR